MKKLHIAIVFGLICAILTSLARFDAHCTELKQNVLRLHVVANSDSEQDQRLKLMVRDALLDLSEQSFKNCKSLNDSITYAKANLEQFRATALHTLRQNGCDLDVSVSIGEADFNNRVYESFTLPAGRYKAVNVIIGEGSGKNWWCVMFPAVCVGASADLTESVTIDTAEVVSKPKQYRIRFKTVELYEKIKKIFKK